MNRYLHTMIRVFDLDKSLKFYQGLGMKSLRKKEVPEGKYTLIYVGFEDNRMGQAEIELTYNWDQKTKYEIGTGFGHLAIGVDDIYKAVEEIRKIGGKISREPGPVQFGTTIIAFVEDPDGYKIELIQNDSYN